MAGVNIPEDMLAPGDKVEIEYQVKGWTDPAKPPVLLNLAISAVESRLDLDPRFDLWSYRFEERVDLSDGQTYRYVIFTVRYREVSKFNPDTVVYEAGIGVGVLLGLFFGALSAFAGAMIYRTFTNTRTAVMLKKERDAIISNPNLSEAEKIAALEAQKESSQAAQQKSIGSGIAAAGGSLVTAAIIIGVLWALSLGSRRAAEM